MKFDIKKWILAITCVIVILGLISVQGNKPIQKASADGYVESLYLPLVLKNRFTWTSPTQFGVQSYSQRNSVINDLTVTAGNYWVRVESLAWDKVESQQGVYQWNNDAETQAFEQELRAVGISGMQPIAVVKFAPEWARKYPNLACGPIAQNAFDDFAAFLVAAIERYSKFPYNVKYWELGNEPDRYLSRDTYSRDVFGCWGEVNEANYGGEYYAEMLKVVYPIMKAADPEAKILIGGLLLDCDYTKFPSDPKCNPPSRFFRGVLENGGADYFDYVSFHSYAPYFPNGYSGKAFGSDLQSSGWAHRGGVVLGKLDFLKWEMSSRGISKPLLLTEAALTCPEWNSSYCNPPSSAFYEAQADYVVWVFVRAWANGVTGTTWYAFEDVWRHNGLVSGTTPKLAYNSYKYMVSRLATASYEKQVTSYKIGKTTYDLVALKIKAYQFSASGKWLWVLWSENEADTIITLPSSAIKAYDKYGNNLPIAGDKKITINHPTYIEFSSAP